MSKKLLDYAAYGAMISAGVGALSLGLWFISWLPFWPAFFLSMFWVGALMLFALATFDGPY
jgi:hypothetical protein